MSTAKVLAAASAAIAAENWVLRKVKEAFPQGGVRVTQVGNNPSLTRALQAVGVDLTISPAGPNGMKRSELRKALFGADYLLLLWDGRTLTELLFEARLRGVRTKVHAIETTEIVNRDRDEPFDAYVGRGTPWGNPFHVGNREGQYEREEAIELYKGHFEKNILGDESLRKGLLSLRGLRIACHCKPLACHGDVIAQYLNRLDPDDLQTERQRPRSATYRFNRDPESITSLLSDSPGATDALKALQEWQSGGSGRVYEVVREGDVDETLEARLTFTVSDERAGQDLDKLCLEHAIRRTEVVG